MSVLVPAGTIPDGLRGAAYRFAGLELGWVTLLEAQANLPEVGDFLRFLLPPRTAG